MSDESRAGEFLLWAPSCRTSKSLQIKGLDRILAHLERRFVAIFNRSNAISRLERKPSWLKIRPPSGEKYNHIKGLRQGLKLATVCEEARCPNTAECWSGGTATFMLLGDTCTRFCKFCNVKTGNPQGVVDLDEPENLADAVEQMQLTYVVLTMVDRDDIDDGGAAHVAQCIQALKKRVPDIKVEMLAGDFQENEEAIRTVVNSGADVFAHNIEVVERLSPTVRDKKCSYEKTLSVLRRAKAMDPKIITKSSIMVGLGETESEVEATLSDLRGADVDIVTVGQYLRPAPKFLPVEEYVKPEQFVRYKETAKDLGFLFCASGPLVRSSYRAGELFLENYLRTQGAQQS